MVHLAPHIAENTKEGETGCADSLVNVNRFYPLSDAYI
ncbi:hypothetical protein GPUN_0375 [Glaciecola punicea ACAM 611]|uniref:Uncharacterized protein n=1 Tax=Glaciecola punicea ACAM 611 TaxID=1121923 RepID=H5T881_9ALTE|nr:hypothetical protein GPUN_0375 [Glaciecola punicea ACAM 611]